MKVIPTLLRMIVPELSLQRATELAGIVNEVCPHYSIDTPRRLAAFLAQAAHESLGFTKKIENLNYTAKRLRQVWPARFPSDTLAAQYAGNPEKLGNYVYGNRMGNGGPETGDGYRYSGKGYIMLTGKDTYLKFARYAKIDIKTAADFIGTTDLWAMKSAAWYFAIEATLVDEADKGAIDGISKRINGGSVGLAERRALYQKALKVLTPQKELKK